VNDRTTGSAIAAQEPGPAGGLLRSLAGPRFAAWTVAATVGSLLTFGLVSAIIPNPVFGREIPPEPFAIAVWLASAPLMGILLATYLVPPPVAPVALAAGPIPGQAPDRPLGSDAAEQRRSLLGYAGGLAAFLAIGCPVCNKIVLVALGTSGALTIWAPLQPLLGAASLVLLAGALTWRLRARARGGACPIA
jgi:hypothetical protein